MRERIPEEEFVKYMAEYKEQAAEMKTPYAIGKWEFEVISPSGGVIHRQSFHCQSWLRNYVNLLCNFVLSVNLGDSLVNWGDSYLNNRQMDGTIISRTTVHYMGVISEVGADDSGILVGSGTTAETFDDYALDTQIAHGRAGGELYHYAGEDDRKWRIFEWRPGKKDFSSNIWRYFLNDSGGDVTVREAGIALRFAINEILVIRDVLASPVVVPDLNVLRVKYTSESLAFP